MKLAKLCLIQLSIALLIDCPTELVAQTQVPADKPNIKVGAVYSLSSWAGPAGVGELNATRLAVDKINSNGGINGQKIKLIVEDNKSDLKETATAITKLISIDKVVAILGPNFSEFVQLAAQLAEKHHMPLLAASGAKEAEMENNKYLFTLWPPFEVHTRELSEYIRSRKHTKIAAVVTENSYFEGVYNSILRNGVFVDKTYRLLPGANDYRSTIAKLKESGADAVLIMLLQNGETSSFLKQAKAAGLNAQLYSGTSIGAEEAILRDKKLADGVIFYELSLVGSTEFLEEYRAEFHEEPIFSSARAYDNVFILAEALKRCGVEGAVVHCLAGTNYSGVIGQIQYGPNGVIKNFGPITRLMRGENEEFKPFLP